MRDIVEKFTQKEGICLLALFTMGSTLHFGIGGEAKNDAWLGGLIGAFIFLPFLLLYAKLLNDFPDSNIFQIAEKVLGKWCGKIFTCIYILYAFHLGGLVIRNFSEYVNTVAMPETPLFIPTLCMGLVCIYAIRLGIEVLGRFATYMLFVLILIILVVQILAIPMFRFENLKPFLGNGFSPVLKSAFSAFAFPFAETVLFLGVLDGRAKNVSPFRIYFGGLGIAIVIIITLTIRNIIVLGGMLSNYYFPAHVAVSRIAVGEFLQRIELTVSIVFLVCTFTKISVCLYVACKGVMHLFNFNNYRPFVLQIGLLMTYFAYTVYDNIMEMRVWAFKVYQYYALPYQVVFPIILFIAAMIYKKRESRKLQKKN